MSVITLEEQAHYKKVQEMADKAKADKGRLRAALRKVDRDILTEKQIAVTMKMLNLWLHHKSGKKGYIHPSRDFVCKAARCVPMTVSRTFAVLRAAGILIPVSGIKGGQAFATRYRFNVMAMLRFVGADDLADEMAGTALVSMPLTLTSSSSNVNVDVKVLPEQNVKLSIEGSLKGVLQITDAPVGDVASEDPVQEIDTPDGSST